MVPRKLLMKKNHKIFFYHINSLNDSIPCIYSCSLPAFLWIKNNLRQLILAIFRCTNRVAKLSKMYLIVVP